MPSFCVCFEACILCNKIGPKGPSGARRLWRRATLGLTSPKSFFRVLEFIFDRVPGAGNSFLRVTVAKNVLTPTHWGLALPGVHDFRRVFSLPVRFVR